VIARILALAVICVADGDCQDARHRTRCCGSFSNLDQRSGAATLDQPAVSSTSASRAQRDGVFEIGRNSSRRSGHRHPRRASSKSSTTVSAAACVHCAAKTCVARIIQRVSQLLDLASLMISITSATP